jgi:hypothetical protein
MHQAATSAPERPASEQASRLGISLRIWESFALESREQIWTAWLGDPKPESKKQYGTRDRAIFAATPADVERFKSYCIEDSSGCLLWSGCCDKKSGHGRFRVGSLVVIASRFAAVWLHGLELPPGYCGSALVVMHVCKPRENPRCMLHLEIGPQVVNIRMGSKCSVADFDPRPDFCPAGHARSEHGSVTAGGHLYCHICNRAYDARCTADPIRRARRNAMLAKTSRERYSNDSEYRERRKAHSRKRDREQRAAKLAALRLTNETGPVTGIDHTAA